MANQVIDPSTQYTEGDTDATVTGTAILWEDTGDTLRAVSAAKPLPVTATDLTTIAGAIRAEDSAHVSGHTGIMALGVINSNAAALAAEGDYCAVNVDNRGRVQLSGVVNGGLIVGEDSPHVSTEGGILAMAVRNDDAATTFTDTNGDYSAIAVTASGKVHISSNYLEDSAHASSHTGTFVLGVQNTNGSTLSGSDLDYTGLATNQKGSVYVDIDIDNISGGQATSILKAEDSAHASGDVGVQMLGVSNPNYTSRVTADDYCPIATTNFGAVFVSLDANMQASAASAIRKQDAASAAADGGITVFAVRKATPADTSGTDGDYEQLQMSAGRLWTSATVTNTVTTTGTATITKTALTPSSPTAATVGATSASALAANASRKGLILTNTSNNTISLGLGTAAVLYSGITLTAFSVWVMDEYSFCTSEIFAIASAASSNLAIQEFA